MNKASTLLSAALAPSTAASYAKAWDRYIDFCTSKTGTVLPVSLPSSVALYISFLVSQPSPSSPATIASTLSALSYQFKLEGGVDPCNSFVIKKIVAGLTKSKPSSDVRVPITPAMLIYLIDAARLVALSPYQQALFPAVFSLMFHGFLRIGEVTDSSHNIQFHNVTVQKSSLSITFISFKHSHGHPITISVSATGSPSCPVLLTTRYLLLRGSKPGPFFSTYSGSPLAQPFLRSFLRSSLARAGLSPLHITPHSFRIGAATYAAGAGASSEQLRSMGRWSSSAFQKYIRIPAITFPATKS